MANLVQKVVHRSTRSPISMDDWVNFFSFGGLNYTGGFSQTISGDREEVSGSFEGLVAAAYKRNGVVFACMLARQLAFSEARFAYRRRTNGRPGDMFGSKNLAVLERPWPGGVTADLLSRAIQDADLAGNFFATRRPNRIRRLRPDWVTIILGSYDDPVIQAGDIDAEVVGYIYHPGGRLSGRTPTLLLREEVAHFAPIPDPTASYRGMSWITPIIREMVSDSAMITHKSRFLEAGATPNLVVTLDPSIKKEAFKEWVEMFGAKHEGAANAYKTLYLGAGSTVQPVGKDFRQMDFATVQSVGENRIAAAAGVPPIIVGLTDGLKSGTFSNYGQALRRFADLTMRPLWRSMANSMEILVAPEPGAELWYDDRDIPFLVEDFKDRADVQHQNSVSIRQLVDAGFEPESAVKAILANDLSLLKHTGLYSVQLQPPLTANQGEAKPKEPTPTPDPEPAPASKQASSRESAVDLLMKMAELRHLVEPQRQIQAPPNVEVHLHDGMVRNEQPISVTTTVEDGAVRVDSPITVEAPTTIADGAVRVEAPTMISEGAVRVEAPTTFADGAVRVEAPTTFEEGAIRGGDVTVEPAQVSIEDGAIRVEAPTTIEDGAVRVEVAPAETRFEEGAIRVEAPTTIESGAVQVDAPVTVERTEVHVDPGAVQVSSPVTVERTEVHVDPGAVQVSAPVTVERTEMRIEDGAVRVDNPVTVERTEVHLDPGSVSVPVTVERTEVHVDPGAVQVSAPVTVERTEVHVDEGAVQVPVTVERTEVHIDEGAVRVDAGTTIEAGAVQVDAPTTIADGAVRVDAPVTVHPAEVRIEEGAVRVDAPVTIEEGAVRVDAPVTMERGSVEVQVDAPVTIEEGAVRVDAPTTIERGAVEVQVDPPDVTIEAPERKKRVVRETEFRMDEDGKIVGKREVETDD